VPVYASCHGVQSAFVTVRQVGPPRINGNLRRMYVSEIIPYSLPPTPLSESLASPRLRGDAAREISARFDRGAPSNSVADAGVLVHIFDGYEDPDRPWQICHDVCRHGPVDSLSSSLISRKVPWLFSSSWGTVGIVISPTVEIMCSFPADSGTGGHPNGRCKGADRASVGTENFYHGSSTYNGKTLRDALEQQYSGSYRKSHFGASGFNEVIISSMYWERALPSAVEAFFYADSERAVTQKQRLEIRQAHSAFLQYYGLTKEEVPLLEFVCYAHPLDPVTNRGPCFIDVS